MQAIRRLWNSPTFTTWASFAARTLSMVVILPILLHRFTPAEVALWQVFSVLIGLQLLADTGFGSTFTRLLAYAMGGAKDVRYAGTLSPARHESVPNWDLIDRICATMHLIYGRLAWIFGSALLIAGTLALVRVVGAINDTATLSTNASQSLTTVRDAWFAWAIILVCTVVNFRFSSYAALLQGTNHIALIRRWEALFGIAAIITCLLVLTLGGGMLDLIVANQAWVVLGVWRNCKLGQHVLGKQSRCFPRARLDAEIFATAWAAAWRAGLGALMSFGLVQFSGLIYAQTGDSISIASYLLGLRLVQTVSQISQAPFYSKLPILARLWAEGRNADLVRAASRGMQLAYWAYVIPYIAIGFMGPCLLELIDSQTPFPSVTIWGMLGLAFLFERYGAMHLQLYSTTNHIVWHIVNGVTGFIFIAAVLVIYPAYGVIALPLGMLIGNASFYSWYSARLSYCQFTLVWPTFDLRTIGIPVVCMCAYLLYAW